ncbi:MFS transporter [Termitidicoccus mucosus]|uniref:Sodium:melibiose symporter n=1 Tax=Termitidicoccus mucosus TaxID=1184151 RepID=A0A178IDP6_9BACT|nr:sodium:melibiose symporter [Opitutaceae bacterium TSB47]
MSDTTSTPVPPAVVPTAVPLRGIAPEDRIPLRQKIVFALGTDMDILSNNLTFSILWLPIFNIGMGMNAILLSGILVALRLFDAFADPVMGNISDNTNTRWGRRRPFIALGTIAMVLVYPLFWHLPSGWGDAARAVALVAIGILFLVAYTLWAMPYYGLQLELTPSYDERTRLAAWCSIFAKFGYLAIGWAIAFILLIGMLASGDASVLEGRSDFVRGLLEFIQPLVTWLSDAQPGEKPLVVGMRSVCWLVGGLMLVCGLLPAIFVKERYHKVAAKRPKKTPFLVSLKESFHCKPLWQLIGMTFFLLIGSAFITGLNYYVNAYYACQGDLLLGGKIAGIKAVVVSVTGLLSIPVLTKLSERFDKRAVAISMLTLTVVGHLANYILMTPAHPYWQIYTGLTEAIAIPAIWMFMPSMKADVADWDEFHTSRRREGSLNSFYSWFVKAAITVSVVFKGAALEWSGFNPKLPAQSDGVVHRMFMLYLLLPIGFWLTSIVFAWFYPISRRAAAETRSALEARRGKA